jgi:hypothetical protein
VKKEWCGDESQMILLGGEVREGGTVKKEWCGDGSQMI